jgi:hypothetical protein
MIRTFTTLVRPGAAADAVAYLRRLTLGRSTRSYLVWIGKSIGWWTVAYLLFWLGAFLVAGIQLLGRLDTPLPIQVGPVSVTVAVLAFALVTYRAKAPPVILGRNDLYRLALSPAQPAVSLRWPFTLRWLTVGVTGLVLGGAWAVVSPYWMLQQAYWAGPALALLLIAHVNLLWLRYTTRGNRGADLRYVWAAPAAAFLALLGLAFPRFGLTAAFYDASVFTLIMPAALALVTALFVHRTLQSTFPPRFAPQCFVLAELQAMRTMNIFSAMMGMVGGAGTDAAYRARLLATLHDKPGVTRPRRSLRLPKPQLPAWRAIAWRTWLMLYRRPLGPQLRTGVFLLVSTAGLLLAARVGAFGLFLSAVLTGNLASQLLGSGNYSATLPLDPVARTRGRTVPGAVLLFITLVLMTFLRAFLGVLPPAGAFPAAATLMLLTLVLLEKYSTWTRTPHQRMEAWVVAALLASAPAFLLGAFGLDGLIVAVQLSLLLLLTILPA